MIRVYDTSYTFVGIADDIKDLCVTTTLETGLKNLSFKVPVTSAYIQMFDEEGYVETADYNYVIKEINFKGNDFFTVYCNANIEDFKGNVFPAFDALDITVNECITKVINDLSLPWTTEFNVNYRDRVQYALAKKTAYECLQQIKEDWKLEYWFDTKNKILKVYSQMGTERGIAFMNELRLQSLTRQGQTYNFATVLYPYGKNGLTIADVNNGKQYIENYDYCSKRIVAYYINEDLEYAEQLKMAAEDYLSIISTPVVSYSVKLSSLPENLSIGDTIYLIDKIKKIKQKQRVVKIIQYPQSPEKDKVEISNQTVNFARMFNLFNSQYRQTIDYVKANLSTLI